MTTGLVADLAKMEVCLCIIQLERFAALIQDEIITQNSDRDFIRELGRNECRTHAQLRDERLQAAAADPAFAEGHGIFTCDFREFGLPDESVDLVFADLPWTDIALHEDLARIAASALKPGRFLLALVGQFRLPEVFAALTTHLTYYWTFTVRYPRRLPLIPGLNIGPCHQPLLLFCKPPKQRLPHRVVDEVEDQHDKTWHEWGMGMPGVPLKVTTPA